MSFNRDQEDRRRYRVLMGIEDGPPAEFLKFSSKFVWSCHSRRGELCRLRRKLHWPDNLLATYCPISKRNSPLIKASFTGGESHS